MTKVFLVNDNYGEGDAYYAASTQKKAVAWIKAKQKEDVMKNPKNPYTRERYEDPKELHPYDIQEMVVDEKY